MVNIKNRYNLLQWDNGVKRVDWISKDYVSLRDEAFDYDARPYDDIKLTGKYIGKFDQEDFKERLLYLSGDYFNYIPTREKVTVQRVNDEYGYETERQTNSFLDRGPVSQGVVPEEFYQKWSTLYPNQYLQDFNNRKNLIDEYLKNFDDLTVLKIKQTMCNNRGVENYVFFLDMDPNTMTSSQKMIYDDIIKFYENFYMNELKEQQDKVDSMKLAKEIYEKNKFNEIGNFKDAEIVDEFDSINRNELFNKVVDNNSKSFDESKIIRKDIQNIVEEKTIQQQNNSNIIRENVVIDDEYMKNFKTLPSKHLKNLFNVPQCYNVADLISARKEAEIRNHELITEIVSDQINTNNSILNQSSNSSYNQNTETQEIPVINRL